MGAQISKLKKKALSYFETRRQAWLQVKTINSLDDVLDSNIRLVKLFLKYLMNQKTAIRDPYVYIILILCINITVSCVLQCIYFLKRYTDLISSVERCK